MKAGGVDAGVGFGEIREGEIVFLGDGEKCFAFFHRVGSCRAKRSGQECEKKEGGTSRRREECHPSALAWEVASAE